MPYVGYNVRDFGDLYTALLEMTREDPSQTATKDQAKRYINEALLEMHMGFREKFPWCIREAVIETRDIYSEGTLSLEKGSAGVVGTGAAFTGHDDFSRDFVRIGGIIKISGESTVYRVKVVVDADNLTLETPYIGDDDATATYSYFEDEYALEADFFRPFDATHFDEGREIELIGRSDFRRRFPKNNITGKPTHATMIDVGPSSVNPQIGNEKLPTRKIRFSRPPDSLFQIPYSYVTRDLAYSGQASGTFVFTENPAASGTIILNGTTWTFVSTLTASDEETLIGADLGATLDQLVSDLNASTEAEVLKCNYTRAGNLLWVSYDAPGTGGIQGDRGDGSDFTTAEISASIISNQGTLELFNPQQRLVSDWDIPIVPEEYRSAIVDLAAYRWYLHKKDDQRAQIARADADSKLARVVEDNEIGTQRPRIIPRVTRYKRSARNPYSPGVSTRYDVNGRFDRLEDR